MKNLYVILFLMLFVNCQQRENHFVDFDEVVHYHVGNQFENLLAKKNRSELNIDEKKFSEIFQEQTSPKTVNDKDFVENIEKFYSNKNFVDKKFYKEISNVFSNKSHFILEEKACDPFYRDILVLKKAGKIIAICKLCFQCNQSIIISKNKSTYSFIKNDDYIKLKDILK